MRVTAVLLSFMGMMALTCTAIVHAEESKREAPQIDAVTGKRLNEAIEFVNAEQFTEAKATLAKLNLDRLSPYERSRVEQMYASIATSENDYDGARKHLEAAVQSGGMNDDEINNARYQIAQLHMLLEQWVLGIEMLKQWFASAPNPNSGAYYLLAIAYYRMEDHDAALEPAKRAVDIAEHPQPNWIELLLALRLEREEWTQAIPLLKHLITLNPAKRSPWVQLAGVYRQLERFEEALAVSELTYKAGHFESASDLKALADLDAYAGIPYRGARLLEAQIANKVVTPDERLWEKISQMWIAARDYDKAMPPLRKAAELRGDGELYVRIAELSLRNEDWGSAVEALRLAFAKGGLDNPGSSQLLMGIALFSQDQRREARQAFEKATEFPSVRSQAQSWIRHIDATKT